MIPEKEHPKWGQLITGEITHKFSNYILQIQVFKLQRDFKLNMTTKEDAINNLYNICQKYYAIAKKDISEIFNTEE